MIGMSLDRTDKEMAHYSLKKCFHNLLVFNLALSEVDVPTDLLLTPEEKNATH